MSWVAAGVAGYQVVSGMQQAEIVGLQAGVQKEIDEFNAELAEYDAWRVIGYGQTQVARYQSAVDKAQGVGKVGAAAAGVEIEGSLAEVAAENETIALANKLEILNQAREKALGYTRQASSIRLGSRVNQGLSKTQQNAIIGGSVAKAGSTLVSGYGSTALSSQKLGTAAGTESGYSLNGSKNLSSSTPGSYLDGTSEDLEGTGYLMIP